MGVNFLFGGIVGDDVGIRMRVCLFDEVSDSVIRYENVYDDKE